MPCLNIDDQNKVRGTDLDFFMRPHGIFMSYTVFVGYALENGTLIPNEDENLKVKSYHIEDLMEIRERKPKLLAELASVGITDDAWTAYHVPEQERDKKRMSVAGSLRVHILGRYSPPSVDM